MNRRSLHVTRKQVNAIYCIGAATYAVLFPLLGQARRASHRQSCLSQCKQLGLALMMYTQDNDGRFPDGNRPRVVRDAPPFRSVTVRATERQDWPRQLLPYIHSPALYRCLKDPSPPPSASVATWSDLQAAVGRGEYPVSYTLNAWVGYGVRYEQVDEPNRWIVLGERNNAQLPSDGPLFFPWMWAGPETDPPWPAPRHACLVKREAERDLALVRHGTGGRADAPKSGKANYLFADGHAKSYRFADAWEQCSFFPRASLPSGTTEKHRKTSDSLHAP